MNLFLHANEEDDLYYFMDAVMKDETWRRLLYLRVQSANHLEDQNINKSERDISEQLASIQRVY